MHVNGSWWIIFDRTSVIKEVKSKIIVIMVAILFWLVYKNPQGCQGGISWNLKLDILNYEYHQKNLCHTPFPAYT